MSKPQNAGQPAAGRPAPLRPFPKGSTTDDGATGRSAVSGGAFAPDATAPGTAASGPAAGSRVQDGPASAPDADTAPNAPDVLRVGTPQDILAFVPHCLGFQPRESLVLLALRGSRLGATLRLDLPSPFCSGDLPDPDQLELLSDYSSRIAKLLSGDKTADGVLAVMYTDLRSIEGTPPPYSALMEILADDLEDSGLRLRDAWLAGNGVWRDYFCGDGACCPWPGYPMGEIAGSRLNAELVYRGSTFAPSLAESVRTAGRFRTHALDERVEEVRRSMEGRWGTPEAFADVLAAWEHRIRSTVLPGHSLVEGGGTAGAELPPSGEGAAGDTPADTREDALLLASLEFKPVRDTILVLAAAGMVAASEGARQWLQPGSVFPPAHGYPAAPGGPDVSADRTESDGPAPADAGRLFRAILIGRSRTAPDWDRLDRTYEAFTCLVQQASGEPAAALLTLLGWIEWARGRSSRAELFLSGALREVPGYRLAALLRELLRRGELPQWAQAPSTAWPGEGPH